MQTLKQRQALREAARQRETRRDDPARRKAAPRPLPSKAASTRLRERFAEMLGALARRAAK